MRTLKKNVFISLLMWLLIALSAWPVFVAVNLAICFLVGECSVIDMWNEEPKRNLLASFIEGYKASATLAAVLGLVAVIDYLLLSKNRLTGYFAGLSIPIFCVFIAFKYYHEPAQVLLSFSFMSLALWVLYKIVDIGFRLRRTS